MIHCCYISFRRINQQQSVQLCRSIDEPNILLNCCYTCARPIDHLCQTNLKINFPNSAAESRNPTFKLIGPQNHDQLQLLQRILGVVRSVFSDETQIKKLNVTSHRSPVFFHIRSRPSFATIFLQVDYCGFYNDICFHYRHLKTNQFVTVKHTRPFFPQQTAVNIINS